MTHRARLLPLFAVASLLPRLLDLPLLPPRVQLTELHFLPLRVIYGRDLFAQLRKYPVFGIFLGIYLAVNVSSGIIAGDAGAVLEGLGRVYWG